MSIASKLESIIASRDTIRSKLVELGLASATDKLATLATKISNIVKHTPTEHVLDVSEQGNVEFLIEEGYHDGTGTVIIDPQSKTATPTKSTQNITPDAGRVLDKVTINPIPEAYQDVTSVTAGAADVLTGKKIVNSSGTVVTGTMTNNGAVSKTLTTGDASYTVPKGYHSGSGAVKIVPEDKSATPTKSAQTITATSGKVLNKVTVNAIPAAYQDVTSVTATAADVLTGKKIVNSSGTVVNGSMANNGAMNKTINGLTTTSVTIPAGYTTGGTVSLTSDIEAQLAAI